MNDPAEKVFEHLRAIGARAFELIHDLEARRKLIDHYFCVHPSTSEVHGQRHPVRTGTFPWSGWSQKAPDPDRRILYIHGGVLGFRFTCRLSGPFYHAYPKPRGRWSFPWIIAWRGACIPGRLGGLRAGLPVVREHGPNGKGTRRSRYLMGDSAGGNLALSSLLKVRDSGLPLPAAVVALSPATDFTCGSPSLVSRAAVDPIINPEVLPALNPDLPRDGYAAHPSVCIAAVWRLQRDAAPSASGRRCRGAAG